MLEQTGAHMTHSFYLNHGSIMLQVSHRGKVYRKTTGLTINQKLWNKKARSLRAKCQDESVWANLRLIHLRMQEKEGAGGAITEDSVLTAIDYAIRGENAARTPEKGQETNIPSFYEYFDEWANRDTPQLRQRRNTLKLIKGCMGDKYDWPDIDTAFYFRLMQKLKEKNYSINYIGSVIKKLKTVMSEGFKLKYHANQDYHLFKSPTEPADTVYLTKEEVERLWELDLSDDLERRVRDLFLLGCYTAMRFSDYSRLSTDNIRGGMIYFTQKKTGGSVVVPASKKVVTILKRNGGVAPNVGQEVFNRKIKDVCFKAQIFEKVEHTQSKGDKKITEVVQKYTLVSSHTARRTAATLLYQSGVPASQVMMITGHKDESSFFKYIRTTKEQNAKMLAKNPFFK